KDEEKKQLLLLVLEDHSLRIQVGIEQDMQENSVILAAFCFTIV
ncbi:3238_t:CDS:2, partial [Gigaspora rosea]